MDQNVELGRVKELIRALSARTVDRGCTEAEAMVAAAKVGELLAVYGLSMTEVDLRDEVCAERRLTLSGPGGTAIRWLFPSLLRFCDCRGWTDGRQDLMLFGLEPDVQMAEWLLGVVLAALNTEAARFHASPGFPRHDAAVALRSFRYGFASRVAARLDALAAERAAGGNGAATPAGANHPVPPSGNDPAPRGGNDPAPRGGNALVLAKARKLDDAFAALGVRLRTVRSRATVRDAGAFGRGEAAGDRVGLERPIAPRGPRPRLPR